MRITAGHARSRVFRTPEGNGTRPTDARTRETLFNILGERIVKARVLDLYAGSGALGLEALSRGAASCLFVEQNAAAVRIIRENVVSLNYENQVTIWQTNVQSAIGRLLELAAREQRAEAKDDGENLHSASFHFHPFDVIIADPPFHRKSELPQLCVLLDKAAPLLHNETEPFSSVESGSPAATLVIQHAWKDEPHLSPHFVRINERRAGESRLSFYQFQIST